ncbi:hypothetical protein GOB94_05540 [Granulicella sp. 5B5]|uniref:hypothetical protein n=1 Tax=Granulicella sp. 5B5 TaxID=1617967 RepID=UPI0015F50D87|nr:hypothetical protein [Granulicella sp. 5B5]QMV18214.1 hypothetical protein GOB94_05540 [Granulicella sp. 5B5]
MPRFMFRLPLLVLLLAAPLFSESKNPADYPLRIHIFGHNQTTFYHNRSEDEAKGEGRANLFENGDVHAVDFSFDCSDRLKNSFGYETYPARWKKPHQELTVLMPVFGKSNAFFTCTIKTDVKDYAYTAHNGSMSSEPSAAFKTWMVKHDYDPEHGKNEPIRSVSPAGPTNTASPK